MGLADETLSDRAGAQALVEPCDRFLRGGEQTGKLGPRKRFANDSVFQLPRSGRLDAVSISASQSDPHDEFSVEMLVGFCTL